MADKTQLALDSAYAKLSSISFSTTEDQMAPSLSVANAAFLGIASVDTTNGTLVIHFENSAEKCTELANAVTGSGQLHLLGDKNEVRFKDTGWDTFTGSVYAEGVILKGSGTRNQLGNASLTVGNGAKYAADVPDNTLGALTVNSGGTLDFTSSALPGVDSSTANRFYVQNGITIKKGAIVNVKGGTIEGLSQDVGQGNLLEQDGNSQHAITLAHTHSDKTVTVEGGAILAVDGETVTGGEKKFKIGEDAWGTYDYLLIARGQDLSVTYGLKILEVNKDKTITLGQNSTDPANDATLSAQVTGSGGLTINTVNAVTLSNGDNNYSGATNVLKDSHLIAKEGALGNTESLNVSNENSKVTIQGNQTGVKSLNVQGELRIESGSFTVNAEKDKANTVAKLTTVSADALDGAGNLHLSGEGSEIKGANQGFSGAVTLESGSTTTIDHAGGLGTGSIEINGSLTGTFDSAVIDNLLTGTGTLNMPNAEEITLTKGIGFSGILDLKKDSTITFNAASDATTLAATIKGASKLNVSGTGASFAFDSADKIAGIKDISLNKVAFTVDEMISGKNLSVTEGELTMSKKTELGDLTLTKTKLLFNAAGTPGTIGEADNHLSVNNLSITGENTIVLDTNQLVAANPGAGSSKVGLTAQDVFKESRSSDLTTVLITTKASVTENGTFKLVDTNNAEITAGDKTFKIADEDGKHVADGIYGYGASVSGGNVGIGWQLKTVSILDGETLSLSEQEGEEDNTLSAKLTGSGSFEAKKGTIRLAAENDYSGATHVEMGARLVAANDKALGKSKDIRNAGTLVITDGKNVVIDGAVENSGTIEVGLGNFRTATYKGKEGSVISLGAHVTADDAETGKFVVEGAATGTSRLDLSITDASVGRAVTGIDVVELGEGSSLELELGSSIKVGDYYYRLMKTDNGARYYLIGSLKDDGNDDPQGGGDDDKKPMTTSQLKTPEAGARAALAFLNQRAFDFGLNAHIGEKSYADPFTGEKKTTSLWLIQGGSWSRMDDSSGQLRNDGHMTTTNLGGDLYAWNAAGGRFSVGLMGGWVDGSYDVDSNITGLKADADFDGWSLGAYAAWQHEGESGLFANAQVRWNDFTNEVKGQGLKKEKYHANGMSLGVEAGWNQRLWTAAASDESRAMAWDTAPFARVTWSGVSADDHTDVYGQRFSVEGDGNVAITLGARTSFEFGSKDQTPRFADPIVRVYAEGAWVHNTKTFESTVVNDKGASTAEFAIDDYGQFRVGLEGEFTKNFRLWGDVTHEAGSSGYSSTGFTVGAKYVF